MMITIHRIRCGQGYASQLMGIRTEDPPVQSDEGTLLVYSSSTGRTRKTKEKKKLHVISRPFLRRVLVSRALVGVSSFRQGRTTRGLHYRRENEKANRNQFSQRAPMALVEHYIHSLRRPMSTPRNVSKPVLLTRWAGNRDTKTRDDSQ